MNKIIRVLTIIFFVAIGISLFIKVLSVWGNNFPFTYDQGRDLIDIRQMIVTQKPRLVGPTTSINGVLLGPSYYYFLILPFLFFSGNPIAIVMWQIVWYQIAVLIFWFVLKNKSLLQANIVGITLSLLPIGFYTARYFWNANAMPIFTILFLASLVFAQKKGTLKKSFLVGLLSGISLQIEAAFGILFFPLAFIYSIFKRLSNKHILSLFVGFFITLIPQILFEFRHGFIMTQTLIAEFSGKEEILGVKYSFMERLPERWLRFINTIRDTNHIPFEILSLIYPALMIVGISHIFSKKKSENINDLSIISILFIIVSCVFFLLFPMQIKAWYTLGLVVPATTLIASILERIFSKNNIGIILVIVFLFLTFSNTLKAHIQFLEENFLMPSDNPSSLKNEMTTVDWIYKEANGQGFNVYSFLPSVYDFQYQYVFWWHGTKSYGYQPQDISYLPNQPEYILNSDMAWKKRRPTSESNLTFLIIENGQVDPLRLQSWLKSFSNLCMVKRQEFLWRSEIRVLSQCN